MRAEAPQHNLKRGSRARPLRLPSLEAAATEPIANLFLRSAGSATTRSSSAMMPARIVPLSAVEPGLLSTTAAAAIDKVRREKKSWVSIINPFVSEVDEFQDQSQWYYKDFRGCVHGPFSSLDMFTWYKAGYLPANLEIRCGEQNGFMSLGAFVGLRVRAQIDEEEEEAAAAEAAEEEAANAGVEPDADLGAEMTAAPTTGTLVDSMMGTTGKKEAGIETDPAVVFVGKVLAKNKNEM